MRLTLDRAAIERLDSRQRLNDAIATNLRSYPDA